MIEQYLGCKVYNRVMDSAGKGMNADEEHSFFDAYQDAGIYLRPAKKNRDMSGFDLITEALRSTSFAVGNEAKTKPLLTIMEGNDEFVWQMSHLRFAEWRGNVTDKDAPEKAQEKRRHLVDCLAYVLLDEPRFIDLHKVARSQPLYNAPGSNQ
jgi:hypothetical protein